MSFGFIWLLFVSLCFTGTSEVLNLYLHQNGNFSFVSVDYAKISLKTCLSEDFVVRLQSGAELNVSELHRLNNGSKSVPGKL